MFVKPSEEESLDPRVKSICSTAMAGAVDVDSFIRLSGSSLSFRSRIRFHHSARTELDASVMAKREDGRGECRGETVRLNRGRDRKGIKACSASYSGRDKHQRNAWP